jgi:hypothetical protein
MVGRELSIHLDVNGQLALAVAVHVPDVVWHILLSYDKKAIGGNIVKNLFRSGTAQGQKACRKTL